MTDWPRHPAATPALPLHRAGYDIVARIHPVPSLPDAAMQVCRLISDPHASPAQVNAIVAQDHALATRMLRLVNSLSYDLPKPVHDLEKAIAVLGGKVACSLLFSIAVLDLLRAFPQHPAPFSMKSLRTRAVVCAALCRLVAERTRACDPDLGFIIGLLKDLGKAILAQYAPEETRAIIAMAREFRLSFVAATRKALGTDDSELCAWLMQAWNLDVDLVLAVRWQYDLDAVEGKPQARFVALAQFAEYLCALKKIRVSGDCHEPQLDQRVWAMLGIDAATLVGVLAAINDEIDRARQLAAWASRTPRWSAVRRSEHRGMDIGEFQRRMRELYAAKDAARGREATFMYLVEEIGELAEACREPERHDVAGEFADCLAWLASLANLYGVDLANAVARKYPARCARCGSSPCCCSGKP